MYVRPPLHSLGLLGLAMGLGSALGGPAVAAPKAAVGGPAPGSVGSIVITDHQLNPALSSYQKDLRSEAKSTLAKNPNSDTWKVHFVAYLNHAAAEDVSVVFYDPEPPKAGQVREPIQAYPLHTKSNAKIVMSQLDLKPEEGFKPGNKYQVLVARLLNNGKEEVYARGSIELTDKDAAAATKDVAANKDATANKDVAASKDATVNKEVSTNKDASANKEAAAK